MQKSLNLFRNLVDWYNGLELPSPDATRHPLPGEGNKVSCAEHTVKDLFTYLPIHLFTFKKVAFTKPSRGTSEARDEFQSTKMLNFRCWNERCRLTRGAAFTLAEVLITLAIIGVVAAMTLPTLIQNHQKQTYVTGLKKAISITSNMFLKMQANEGVDFAKTSIVTDGLCNSFISENGCEDAYGNPSVLETIIPKYLNVVKICKNDAECTTKYTETSLSCTNNKCTIGDLDGKYGISHLTQSRTKASFRGFYTNDGMIYYIELGDAGPDLSLESSAFHIYVDINGDKGPNKNGRDLFSYTVLANEKIYIDSYVGKIIKDGWKMNY